MEVHRVAANCPSRLVFILNPFSSLCRFRIPTLGSGSSDVLRFVSRRSRALPLLHLWTSYFLLFRLGCVSCALLHLWTEFDCERGGSVLCFWRMRCF